MASAKSKRFILSPFELSAAPMTVHDTGAGLRTDSSQPGRSIDEPNRPRGLGIRASRIRRPRPGAARTKNPMRVAKPTRSTLGAPPPAEPVGADGLERREAERLGAASRAASGEARVSRFRLCRMSRLLRLRVSRRRLHPTGARASHDCGGGCRVRCLCGGDAWLPACADPGVSGVSASQSEIASLETTSPSWLDPVPAIRQVDERREAAAAETRGSLGATVPLCQRPHRPTGPADAPAPRTPPRSTKATASATRRKPVARSRDRLESRCQEDRGQACLRRVRPPAVGPAGELALGAFVTDPLAVVAGCGLG